MQRALVLGIVVLVALSAVAGERVPGEQWLRYADPADAGFDAAKLGAAEELWKALDSSAFMVVADGAVVAAWGDVERRFMCHSVRKSFMSALYGIYWDQGKIELNKTLADLGIDDQPDGLLENEKRARILDLLKARSGVFHPAAYAGRTDSQPRGSQGPGRYFAYNNWDFNTLATILEQETGDTVFGAFDQFFGRPLGMQDWRVSDGYYHYELDKSEHPAYPFRMSARDAARFGLLFARDGMWGDERILSRHWVRRSTALYSIDDETFGYGLLWWIAREPRFARYGFAAALGVGNQMIAVLPDIDVVIVNRADTYDGERTPMAPLLDLIEAVLNARTGEPAAAAELAPLAAQTPDPRLVAATDQQLAEFAGEWPYPPTPLGLPQLTTVSVAVDHGALLTTTPVSGTFRVYLQPDGSFLEEDSFERYTAVRDESGAFAGYADADAFLRAALAAVAGGDSSRAKSYLAQVGEHGNLAIDTMRLLIRFLEGEVDASEAALHALAVDDQAAHRVEGVVNTVGYSLLQAGKLTAAQAVFDLNTRLFPAAANTWDSLAELHMTLGQHEEAIRLYRKSLELNPDNSNAQKMIDTMLVGGEGSDSTP